MITPRLGTELPNLTVPKRHKIRTGTDYPASGTGAERSPLISKGGPREATKSNMEEDPLAAILGEKVYQRNTVS